MKGLVWYELRVDIVDIDNGWDTVVEALLEHQMVSASYTRAGTPLE